MADDNLSTMLQRLATVKRRPDDSTYSSLRFTDEKRLAEESGLSHYQVQMKALEQNILPERYARNQKSLTTDEQLLLLKTHVAIVGLGGLGGAVTEILARVGVGRLSLVDGDIFDDSNLNRQLLSSVGNLGREKACVAAERVTAINPAVIVQAKPVFLTSENHQDVLGDADLAVDCLDSISDRFVLEDGCRKKGICMVSGAIGGRAGQVMVVSPGDPGLSQIYGSPENGVRRGVETVIGTLPYTAVTIAAIECAEVVALAINKKSLLENTLLITDLASYSMDLLTFS